MDTKKVLITRKSYQQMFSQMDEVSVEEPLEIRLVFYHKNKKIQKSISVTMRTPGDDKELVAGFLFTEGIIAAVEDIATICPCGPVVENSLLQNIMRVELKPEVEVNTKHNERNSYTTSSCGICGKSSLEALFTNNLHSLSIRNNSMAISCNLIHSLPSLLYHSQKCFSITGGVHAAALFTNDGKLLHLHEDVGRHNAMDKTIGKSFLDKQIPLHRHIVVLSGRISFELIQKASMAGITCIVAIGSPSSLAIELAEKIGITIIGFTRENSYNIYTHHQRVVDTP